MSKSTQSTTRRPGTEAVLLADAFAGWLAASGVPIVRGSGATSHADTAQTIPAALPPVFRVLIMRYCYLAFEAGALWFYANTKNAAEDNWATAAFVDPYLTPPLLAQGLVPFARPDTGSYDPVCFDTRRPLPDGDCPLVQIDHEQVLCHSRIGNMHKIAPSFAAFVEHCLATKGTIDHDYAAQSEV